ncbi:MAG: transglycosylase domain-containing protein [Actinomycetes bacterium]
MRLITWWMRLCVVVVAGALIVAAIVVAIAPRLWNATNAHSENPVGLPPWEGIAQRTYVYDIAGNEIAAYELENSQPVSIGQIPPDVLAAVLAVEDREFYHHHGVNVRGLFRATLSNFEGGARQGASTITQQVVKVEYLGGSERDGRYKLLQIIYALRLEKEHTKQEILERYLNTIYFGNNTYGIQAAAEVYFGKKVGQLTLIEGAFLAGLIQAPSSYDPIRKPQQSRRRFAQVLDALVDVGLTTATEVEAIKACLDPAASEGLSEKCVGSWQIPEVVRTIAEKKITRTHFSEEVKSYLLNKSNILGDTYQERYNKLFRGGLKIYTTLDPVAQTGAEAARATELPVNSAGIETAIVTLDSKTGAVRAMVGGKPFVAGRSEVNMALGTRQTGSSIKMFILAAAIQAGVQNDDLIDGAIPCLLPNPDDPKNPFEITNGVSRPLGPLEEMTWYSINCAYARLSQIVGLDRVVDTTYRMAKNLYLYPERNPAERDPLRPYASFATGANEMSPLDMASGAQTLANNGIHMQPYYVERIEGPQGTVYQHQDDGVAVLTAEAAAKTTSILTGVLISGTARRSQLNGRVAAGKTGTQDNNTNSWMVGYTPDLVTAVWVGHPDLYLPMVNIPEFVAVGVPRVLGGTFPSRIWKATMDAALAGRPSSVFATPVPNPRLGMRLYLPGTDCLTSVTPAPRPTFAPPVTVPAVGSTDPSSSTLPPTTTSTTLPPTTTTSTTLVPPKPGTITDLNTTVPRGQVDPTWPVPTIDPTLYTVAACPS